MRYLIAVVLLTLSTLQAQALNWQDDNLDWMGGHASSFLNQYSTENLDLMLVQTRDHDEYGLYHFQFACVLGPNGATIHIGLSVPVRNPYAQAPDQNDLTLRYEFSDGAAHIQTVQMRLDPLGDESISWDGSFPLSQAFLANFAGAQFVTLFDANEALIHRFESRGSALAAASLGEYCTNITP